MATLLLLLTGGNWMEDREDGEVLVGGELFRFFYKAEQRGATMMKGSGWYR